MKQKNIIISKFFDAIRNGRPAIFPCEFYRQSEIIDGLGAIDMKNVAFSFRFGKTDKGFNAFIFHFLKN
ncbi:MAG: hypothetical protein ACRCZB_03535 [Bacteroidales bacterium]